MTAVGFWSAPLVVSPIPADGVPDARRTEFDTSTGVGFGDTVDLEDEVVDGFIDAGPATHGIERIQEGVSLGTPRSVVLLVEVVVRERTGFSRRASDEQVQPAVGTDASARALR